MNLLTRMNIRLQLLLLFIIMVLPVLLLNWYASEKAANLLKNHVSDAYVELIKQNHLIIDRDIDTVHNITSAIILNAMTQSFALPSRDELDRVDRYENMDKLLSNYSLGFNGGQAIIYSFFVPDPDNQYGFAPRYRATIRPAQSSRVYFLADEERPPWYDRAVELKGKGFLTVMDSDGQSTLAYVRAVNYIHEGSKVIGVVVATSLERKIEGSIEKVSLPEGDIYFTNLDNRLYAGTSRPLGNKIDIPIQGIGTKDTYYTIESDRITVVHTNFVGQHKLIYEIPIVSLVRQQDELKDSIQLISTVYFVLCFFVMVYFLRSMINPLVRMVSFFKSYEPGKQVLQEPVVHRRDEVGVLTSSIYDMAERLNRLVHDKYIMEIKQKETELQVLYEQINPHLLYNTLESIYWKCAIHGDHEAAEMIKDLSKLMKIGLSRGRDLISFEEEMEHARAYIGLQQKRYDYEFRVNWRIQPEVLGFMIPKITLQPLIENAILHAIRNMGEDGLLTISAHAQADVWSVTVEDNGFKHVDYDRIHSILGDGMESHGEGYGIRNVHKRIRLHCGEPYGLSYESAVPHGTRVTVKLPILDD